MRLRIALATLALVLSGLVASPAQAYAHLSEPHCVTVQRNTLWHKITICGTYWYHGTRYGIMGTALKLTGPCRSLEYPTAFTGVFIGVWGAGPSHRYLLGHGRCRDTWHFHQWERARHRIGVRWEAHVRRDAAPDPDVQATFHVCKDGNC